MIKKIASVALLAALTLGLYAQQPSADSTTGFSIAVNAEQMLEKIGFENLMKAVFENKKPGQKINAAAAAQKTTVRKALAAIYGAGINFDKKMWFSNWQKQQRVDVYQRALYYKDMETPMRLFIIPVANRQVMQDNILKIINTGQSSQEEKPSFITKGDVAYMQIKKAVLLLTNTELLIAALPAKIYDYNDDVYNGITVKSDTVITPAAKKETLLTDSSMEVIEKPANFIEIDKLLPNGKIKRVYTYKEPAAATVKPVDAVVEEVAATADSAVMAADTTAMATAPATDVAATKDTLQRTEYINDTTYVTHYYLPYSQDETDSLNAAFERAKNQRFQEKINAFVNGYKTYLPVTNSIAMQQLIADTADITIYMPSNGIASTKYMGGLLGVWAGGVAATPGFKQPAPITSISFTNGLMKMTTISNCCGDTSSSIMEKMYKPVTAFWPAALGKPTLGQMQYNVDMPQLINYITNAAGNLQYIHAEMKRDGFELADLQQVFNGEIAVALHPGLSKTGKKQPRLLVAFKLNNPAAAVKFMNQMGNRKLRSTSDYRFDENAQYLLVDTDRKNGLLTTPVTTAVPLRIPENSAGYMQFSLKNMITSLTKESKKTDAEYKQALQFLGNLQMNTVKNAAQGLTTIITVDMGSNKTNALYNLLQFISNNAAGRTAFRPLRSIIR